MTKEGNYTNTVVRDNTIYGGFASSDPDSPTETKGQNNEDAIIKSVAKRVSILFLCLLNLPLLQDRYCDWTSDLVRRSILQKRQRLWHSFE